MASQEKTVSQPVATSSPCADQDCSICYEALIDPVEVPCGNGHIFCRDCIAEWLKVGHTCPFCRVVLHDDYKEDGEEQEEELDDEEAGEFDEEEYRNGLLDFIDQINAVSPEDLRISVRGWVVEGEEVTRERFEQAAQGE